MKNVEVILRNDMLKQFESALHRLKVHSDTSPDEPSWSFLYQSLTFDVSFVWRSPSGAKVTLTRKSPVFALP